MTSSGSSHPALARARLVLADGAVFEGQAIGHRPAEGVAAGEVVFNTVMSGYQEVITDPSYAGQIISFTYPHIGNYGVNDDDNESRRPFCRGVIVRDLARRHSNHTATGSLDAFLVDHGVPGIAGVDTRRLTRHIRDQGAMPGAFGTADVDSLVAAAEAETGTTGVDLVSQVTCAEPYQVPASPSAERIGGSPRKIVALDFGIKTSILRQLAEIGTVEVVPAATSAADVLGRAPDGVFLSNGPGDPEMVAGAVETIEALVGQVPIFGICLGQQLLGLALGGRTYKLPFGHHGGNHPIRREETGQIEITSQNHNFAVAADSIDGVEITHINLNDQVVSGLRAPDRRAFGVQYHPEAGPGPHDARYLFGLFADLMDDETGAAA